MILGKYREPLYYKHDSNGSLYRLQNYVDVRAWNSFCIWDEEKNQWIRCDDRRAYTDIAGSGGNWYDYTEISGEEAFGKVRLTGGTEEEFVKGIEICKE